MSENQVKISYKPLWKLLIDRDMTKTELRKRTQIAPSTFTKMNNDQQVSLDILARICVELKCGFDDMAENIKKGSKVSIAAACFSMYAYKELKKQLEGVLGNSLVFMLEKSSIYANFAGGKVE